MAAITTTADGEYIYLALESGGNPVIVRCSRDDLSTFTLAYAPGSGSAANVAQVPGNADRMLFYGNFGSGVQVVSHVVSTGAETNISPTGLTTKVVNGLCVNPSDPNEIIVTVNTDFDLLQTTDGGATWETQNAAVGFDPAALAVLWQDEAEYHIVYLAGEIGGFYPPALRYSPNGGNTLQDITGPTLGGLALQEVGIEAVYAIAA